jgi:hypothetical protein
VRRAVRRAPCPAWLVLIALVCPSPAHAWGFEVHKFIMDRAIALLPDGLRPVFERHRAVAIERAIDPDTWIVTGGFDEEAPRHFLNLDADGHGAYPFRGLPRDHAAAVAAFGERRVRQNGTLPWRADEFFDRLRDAFAATRFRSAGGELDAVRLAAALSHYISDAHVPFHAVTNYDGQLTNQRGIHARFETMLFARFRSELALAPRPRPPMRGARDAVFEALLEGTRLAPDLLRADRAAAGGTPVYDDAYYEAFFRGSRAILERRLSESVAAVAAAIAGAWEAAG